MAPKELDKLIEKYLAGTCTEEERDLIDAFYANLGSRERSAPDGLDESRERMFSGIHRRIIPVRGRHRRLTYYTGIAAAISLLIITSYYLYLAGSGTKPVTTGAVNGSAYTTFHNPTSDAKRVILPDGSIVRISPQGELRYRDALENQAREAILEGEAYFDVAHNSERPFFVYAGNVVTRVLGTSFVVRNAGTDDRITISVKTGKVTVYSRNATHKQTVLTRNQEAVYDRKTDLLATQSATPAEVEKEDEHLTEMHFDETPVPEVLSRLVQAYQIDIVFPESVLAGCVLTSSFFEEGLYDRIDVICTAIGATYSIVDGKIVIESNGCNLKPN